MAVCFNYFLSIAIFLNIDISQGSVATRLRCGGIFKYESVANLPVSLLVKEFWKSVNISGSYGQEFGVLFFSETQCSMMGLWCRCGVHGLRTKVVGHHKNEYSYFIPSIVALRSVTLMCVVVWWSAVVVVVSAGPSFLRALTLSTKHSNVINYCFIGR